MSRCISLTFFTVALTSCGDASRSEDAASVVVRDMVEAVPAEMQSVQQRRISGQWQSAGRGPVPAGVLAASGLPVIDTVWRPGDSLVLVLNLFEPRALSGDSVEVVAEWLEFDPDQDFWGMEYRYELLCRASCELLKRPETGYLN